MNKISGSCAGLDGMYDFEVMWSCAGRRVFWDSQVTKDGEAVGTPGGLVTAPDGRDIAEIVEAEVRKAISAGLRRQHERQA